MHRRPPLPAIMIASALATVNSQGGRRALVQEHSGIAIRGSAEPGPIDVFNQAFFVADVLDSPSVWTNCAAFDSFQYGQGTNQRLSRLPGNHHPRSGPPRQSRAKNSKPFPDSKYMHFPRSRMPVGVSLDTTTMWFSVLRAPETDPPTLATAKRNFLCRTASPVPPLIVTNSSSVSRNMESAVKLTSRLDSRLTADAKLASWPRLLATGPGE